MAGLVPAIHAYLPSPGLKDVDARHKAGHDGVGQNKKYRCAIGSTSAGSQVRSSPSAVTS
jgi:hypothetical protein